VRRLLVGLFVSVLTLTACGGGDSESSASTSPATSLSGVTVSGDSGEEPTVEGVKGFETSKVVSDTVSEGDGELVADGDTVNVDYVLYDASTGKSLQTTYDTAEVALPIDETEDPLLAGSIIDSKIGGRLIIAAPASDFYGDSAQTAGLSPDDTLVLVTELVSKFAAPKPTGTISDVTVTGPPDKEPSVEAMDDLFVARTQSKVLRTGKGVTLRAGDSVEVDYVGFDARTGETFDSSYESGTPATFTLDDAVIKGFSQGLVGKKVGSRVLITVPYSAGYGPEGNPQAKIEGGDSLIFVIDILSKPKATPAN